MPELLNVHINSAEFKILLVLQINPRLYHQRPSAYRSHFQYPFLGRALWQTRVLDALLDNKITYTVFIESKGAKQKGERSPSLWLRKQKNSPLKPLIALFLAMMLMMIVMVTPSIY